MRTVIVVAILALVAAMLGGPVAPARAATPPIVKTELEVLVVSDASTASIERMLGLQGVPVTRVRLGQVGRPTINEAFLAQTTATTRVAHYQAIVLPNLAGGEGPALSAAELDSIAAYAALNSVRLVAAYDWRSANNGLGAYLSVGNLDGLAATVTDQGQAGPFTYLTKSLTFDDVDPAVNEAPGYLAAPASPSTGAVVPFVTGGGGVVVGTYQPSAGRWLGTQILFLTFQAQSDRTQMRLLGPGIVEWLTGGNHLGLQRSYLAVHVDDVVNEDARWNATRNCTPDEDCPIDDPTTPVVETLNPIRMTPADVTTLTTWQAAKALQLDMAFNAAPSTRLDGTSLSGNVTGPTAGSLTKALLDAKASLRWINHTYDHVYYGCNEVRDPSGKWVCATPLTYVSQPTIAADIADNLTWAARYGLTSLVNSHELISGEHSGLSEGPTGRITQDNPNFVAALSNPNPSLAIKVVASDASRELEQRAVGDALTLPRYPNSLYYNVSTPAELVDEYNHIYLAPPAGVCQGSSTNTCLPEALPADGFANYIAPFEARQTLNRVLDNDPRPHFTHQSNLAGDGLVYTWLDLALGRYSASVDARRNPIIQPTMTEAADVLSKQRSWAADRAQVAGYVKGGQLVVTNTGSAAIWVPLSAATGTTARTTTPWVSGIDDGYNGTRSKWVRLDGGASLTLDVAPNALPTATIATPACTLLTCTFDGGPSVDPDGTILSYGWSLGDGSAPQTAAVATASHSFPQAGTYTVTLTVTDNRGGVGTTTLPVTVTGPPNTPPTAAAAPASCTDLTCSFDGSRSIDADPGDTIASYAWVFDGSDQASGPTPQRTFTTYGDHTATLTVTDNRGATSTPVTITFSLVRPNAAPTAFFTTVCDGLACAFDASGSSDPDGSLTLYSWMFGDGGSGTGVKPAGHIYGSAGAYPITLTVFDDKGASATATQSVTVAGVSPVVTPTPVTAPVAGPVTGPTLPSPKVMAKAVSGKSTLKVDINPNLKGSKSWRFQVQRRQADGTWTTLRTVYRTKGSKETRTINLRKGVYRAMILVPQHGYGTGQSPEVTLRR